jgi:hypothetical protein
MLPEVTTFVPDGLNILIVTVAELTGEPSASFTCTVSFAVSPLWYSVAPTEARIIGVSPVENTVSGE